MPTYRIQIPGSLAHKTPTDPNWLAPFLVKYPNVCAAVTVATVLANKYKSGVNIVEVKRGRKGPSTVNMVVYYQTNAATSVHKKRGRPPGSKNKPKVDLSKKVAAIANLEKQV